jgi:hypothetical protein
VTTRIRGSALHHLLAHITCQRAWVSGIKPILPEPFNIAGFSSGSRRLSAGDHID